MDVIPLIAQKEVVERIVSNLGITEIAKAAQVSRLWNKVCKSETKKRQTMLLIDHEMLTDEDEDSNFVCAMFKKSVTTDICFDTAIKLFKSTFTNIRTLCIYNCEGFEDNKLYLIGKYLPYLTKLWIEDIALTDDGLSSLFSHCDRLKILVLFAPDITGSCLNFLPPLKKLTITDFEFDDVDVDTLSARVGDSLENLGLLFYGYNPLSSLFNCLKNLRSLRFDCIELSSSSIKELIKFLSFISNLEELFIFDCPTFSLKELKSFPCIPCLKSVFIETQEKNDEKIAELIGKFPNVEYFKLQSHLCARKSRLFKSLEAIKQLKKLREYGCEFIIHQEYIEGLLKLESLQQLQFYISNDYVRSFVILLKQYHRKGCPLTVQLVADLEGFTDFASVLNVSTNLRIQFLRNTAKFWPFIELPFIDD